MQTCVNIQTEAENIYVSTVLMPHKGKCTGEYEGKLVDRTVVITCGKCGVEYTVEMDTGGEHDTAE